MTAPAFDIRVDNISANTPASMLTQPIDYVKQRKLVFYIGIERVEQQSGTATGTVDVYVKYKTARNWSKLNTVDLEASNEIDVQTVNGTYTEVKVVPNNVVGAFNLSILGY